MERYAAPMSGGYFIVVFVSLRLGLFLGLDLFRYEITDVVDQMGRNPDRRRLAAELSASFGPAGPFSFSASWHDRSPF